MGEIRHESAKSMIICWPSASRPNGHADRLFLDNSLAVSDSMFREFWQPISVLGATFENANNHFVAVDMPPGLPIDQIYKLMETGEQADVWEFEGGYRYRL
jgi:hypothetical protein